jgi:phosphoribosylglycinamide formyltransferase-1
LNDRLKDDTYSSSKPQTVPLPIVVLLSGSGSNLQAIIDGIEEGTINARICAVISNRPDAYGLERARKANIPVELINHNQYDSRESFDAALTRSIEKYHPELIVLAGFMRILTDDFVNHFYGKMINIHPSLLPKYRGLHTHKRALESGDSEHGLSIHYVSAELDGGPIIFQATVPVLNDDTEDTLAQRVLVQEHLAYPKVIQWFAEKRLQLIDNQVIMDNKAVSL